MEEERKIIREDPTYQKNGSVKLIVNREVKSRRYPYTFRDSVNGCDSNNTKSN